MSDCRVIFILALLCILARGDDFPHPLSDEFIDLINSQQSQWIAGRNFAEDDSLEDIKKLMGVIKSEPGINLPERRHDSDVIASLPEHFDSRRNWPFCPSLFEIRDQGKCGSCWAFGAVEAMTDRVCIASNSTMQFHFAAQDLVSCCKECGGGCEGGIPEIAWQYWVDTGIVSGGGYNSHVGCYPYEAEPCNITTNCFPFMPTPDCKKSCRPGFHGDMKHDKVFGKTAYILRGEDQMKADIYKNGPIEVVFDVYEDFLTYKSGVYRHTRGKQVGGHAVKMIGWGIEYDTKYWLISNSWSKLWGDQGYFKILRGEDHCGIEDYSYAGEPRLRTV